MSQSNLKQKVQTLERQILQMRTVFTSLTDFLGIEPGIKNDGTILWRGKPKPPPAPDPLVDPSFPSNTIATTRKEVA